MSEKQKGGRLTAHDRDFLAAKISALPVAE
jgi:hypothetical protein